jgi:hypothetical protein
MLITLYQVIATLAVCATFWVYMRQLSVMERQLCAPVHSSRAEAPQLQKMSLRFTESMARKK